MRKRSAPRRHQANKKKPVALDGTPIQLSIEGLSHEGRGIARHDGKTLFVAGALPGEEVEARITKTHRRFDEAQCINVIQASEDRAEPICEHYGVCGGCDLQHLTHSRQIEEKQRIVLDQLERLGKIQPESTESPLHSPASEYRRSARLGVNQLQRDNSVVVGFRRRASNKLTRIDHCPVLNDTLNQTIQLLQNALDQAGQVRDITHAEISMGDQEGALTLRIKKRPSDTLLDAISLAANQLHLRLYLDDGQNTQAYADAADLHYRLPDQNIKLSFEPGDFLQVNAGVNEQMISRALEWLQPTSDDRILDLFSGIGNFTLPLALNAGEVVGVEGSDTMVQRAASNAEANGLTNCAFYRANLSNDLRHHRWFNQGFNKIVLDPPRTGALEAIKQLEHYQANQILYVSCNPSALARDAAELVTMGYRFSRFCVMDMFPQTSHVESLALFEKPEK